MDQEKYIEIMIEKLERAITDGFASVNEKLDKKASHEDVKRIEKMVDNLERKKLDRDEFEPFKSALSKINRLLISAVIGALLYLVINSNV